MRKKGGSIFSESVGGVSPGDWDYDIYSESLGKMGWIVVDIG